MTASLAHIVRHPIKAIGWEETPNADLTAGLAMPWDRTWAVAHDAAQLTPGRWAHKSSFLRGAASSQLMAVRCTLDEASQNLRLVHPSSGEIAGNPNNSDDAARLVDWMRPLWPENRPPPAALIRSGEQPFTDVPEKFVSVLNLSSNRTLAERLGQPLSIHRWRGNLWLDGLAPWEEFDLIGRTLRIGDAELKVEVRIKRCRATCGNPETGRLDADTLGALSEGYGHEDFGVYALIKKGGRISVGDRVTVI